MPNPTKYAPQYSFSGFQAQSPDRPLPAMQLDNELQNIADAAGETIDALQTIRRSDGQLVNEIVTVDSLSRPVRALIAGVSDPGSDGIFPITDVIGLQAALDGLKNASSLTSGVLNSDRLPTGNGAAKGAVALSNSITSALGTGNSVAATPLAVKTVADLVALKADKATTLAGYGIADAYTKLQTNQQIDAAIAAGGGGSGGGSDTPSQVLEKIKTVDGSSSGLDADLLDGNEGAFYRDAGNMLAGTMPIARLPVAAINQTPTTFAKADAMQPTRLFAAPTATPDMQSDKLLRVATPFNSTNGNYAASGIEIAAEGSAFNGPRTASLGHTISAYKEGFGTGTAKAGEIDNIYLVLRQDGPRVNDQDTFGANRSDGCGILIDAAVYPGVGFVGAIEGATSVLAPSNGAVDKRVVYQIGCVDTTTNSKGTAYFASAAKGSHAAAFFAYNAEADGGYFDNFIYCGTNTGSVFTVARDGAVSFGRHVVGGNTLDAKMHVRLNADAALAFLNNNKTVQVAQLTQGGVFDVVGSVNAPAINAANTLQVPYASVTSRLRISPSSAAENSANWIAGTFFVGSSGRPRYCDENGKQPKFIQLSTT